MPYRIQTFNPTNKSIETYISNIASESEAIASILSDGKVLVSIERTYSWQLPRAGVSSQIDVAWWCKELRTLLGAGMTVVEAIDTLNGQSTDSARRHVNSQLVHFLGQGQSLSAAMRNTKAFPDLLIASVKASEQTSSMLVALEDYLRYDSLLKDLRKKIVSAAIYPSVVVALGLLITLVLLFFVIPRFSKMYTELHGSLSFATRVILFISQGLTHHGPLILLLICLLFCAAIYYWRSGALGGAILGWIESIPALHNKINLFRLAKLYHSLALMYKGGFSLNDSLAQTSDLGLGEKMRIDVIQAQTLITEGKLVSTSFQSAGLCDNTARRLLAVGERTGNFDKVLQTIAERYSDEFSSFVDRATRIVEPSLLLIVALIVGGIVVMMYMPIFDIASSFQ